MPDSLLIGSILVCATTEASVSLVRLQIMGSEAYVSEYIRNVIRSFDARC